MRDAELPAHNANPPCRNGREGPSPSMCVCKQPCRPRGVDFAFSEHLARKSPLIAIPVCDYLGKLGLFFSAFDQDRLDLTNAWREVLMLDVARIQR